MLYADERAPAGWKPHYSEAEESASLADFDPFVCPKCRSEMKVIPVIEEQQEIRRILRRLTKIGRLPPGLDPAALN